ncbi:MAG: hypothetical protein BGO31_15465 [Bacteroidetes bacterium 43-16]|nr:MAG: hypothetical protein BGO31_15465 [Bacteroidetes bacterium 43-16]
MEKITVKELVKFRNKGSQKSKRSFALKLKTRKPKERKEEEKSGGNYWSISNSTIYNTFKYGKDEYYDKKIEDVLERYKNTDSKKDKDMYQRNLDILRSFKEFDILNLRPPNINKFETIHKSIKIITIQGLPIYLNPDLVFNFEQEENKFIGALLLVPKLHGFTKADLGIFCEVLYSFLTKHYSNDFKISKEYCIAIDTFNASKISYLDITIEKKPSLLNATLLEIKNLI